MELDELKQSWNKLNQQLEKDTIADENEITNLVSKYKANTDKSLKRLTGWQRLSISLGFVGLFILLIVCLLPSVFHIGETYQSKVNALIIFFAISLIIGICWDYQNYVSIKSIRVDSMPVAEVSKRMLKFRQWMKYEVIAISIWIILFNVVNYWVMDYYLESANTQALLILFFLTCDVVIIYFLYKKIAYKHLNKIKKNIEDLKDICTE